MKMPDTQVSMRKKEIFPDKQTNCACSVTQSGLTPCNPMDCSI